MGDRGGGVDILVFKQVLTHRIIIIMILIMIIMITNITLFHLFKLQTGFNK